MQIRAKFRENVLARSGSKFYCKILPRQTNRQSDRLIKECKNPIDERIRNNSRK